ncbi:hypothetical protein [Escherichia phage PJNS034]
MDNKPQGVMKEWLVGVATSLSVITLGLALTLYTDVQILKAKQEQQSSLSTVVASLEKQVALNNQALDAVKDALRELKEDKRK